MCVDAAVARSAAEAAGAAVARVALHVDAVIHYAIAVVVDEVADLLGGGLRALVDHGAGAVALLAGLPARAGQPADATVDGVGEQVLVAEVL